MRSLSLGLGFLFFLLYYLLLSMGRVYGERGIYPPVVWIWMPNGVLGLLGAYFCILTNRDRRMKVALLADFLSRRFSRTRKKRQRP